MLLEKAALQYVAFSGTNIDGGGLKIPAGGSACRLSNWRCWATLANAGTWTMVKECQLFRRFFLGPAIKHMASWEILQSNGSMKVINTCGFCIATFDYQSVLKIGSMKLRREHEYKMYLIVFDEIMLHPYLFHTYLCQRWDLVDVASDQNCSVW